MDVHGEEPVEKKAKSKPELPIVECEQEYWKLGDCKIVSDVPSDLTCTICLNAFTDPVQCNGGGHMFCRECIVPVTTNPNARCPIGGQQCKPLTVNELHVVPAMVRNALRAVHVMCPMQCDWIGSYESLHMHVDECEFRQVWCKWCKDQIRYTDIDIHIDTCSAKPISCIWCKQTVSVCNMSSHLNDVCDANPGKLLHCVCGETVLRAEQEQHMLSSVAKHLVALTAHVKLVSTLSFVWAFTFTEQKHETSTSFNFAGLDWIISSTKVDDAEEKLFAICLHSINTKSTVLISRCVNFTVRKKNSESKQASNIWYRNDGKFKLGTEITWTKGGYGPKLRYPLQKSVLNEIECTVEIIY